MSTPALRLEIKGPIAEVWLCRPEVHNAFSPDLLQALATTFQDLATREEVRVILLAGEGRSFCAGANLNWMREVAQQNEKQNLQDALRLAAVFRAIDHCPQPVVGRVQGAAIGGGMGLVSVCDIVVASTRARFCFSEARLGLAPAVISPFVVARIGVGSARELFLTARRFDAQDAQRLGFVHHVVTEEELDSTLQKVFQDLLACAPSAQAFCKSLLRELPNLAPEEVDPFTAKLIAELRSGAEGSEGMSAFLEKRSPNWLVTPPAPTEAC